MLYITTSEPDAVLVKYDPFVGTYQESNGAFLLVTPWGILVKEPYLYVANPDGNDGFMIVQYDTNLQFVRGYGDPAATENTSRGMFYGPRNFVAILSNDITIVDENLGNLDKLISMNDMNGSLWQTYGSYGSGEGFFHFYNYSS